MNQGKSAREKRRRRAIEDFDEASRLAREAGLQFVCCDDHLYHLGVSDGGWLINVYPGNCRLYADPNRPRAPYLQVETPWTLLDVVRSAVKSSEVNRG